MKSEDYNKKENQNIELLARAFIVVDNKVLLCERIGRGYYFIPGGHIELGEGAKEALMRELKEEAGVSVKNLSFIGAVEHKWEEDNQKHQEINLIFSGRIEKAEFKSKEDHIDFVLKDLKSFAKAKVLPRTLRDALLEWLKNKKPFWKEYKG